MQILFVADPLESFQIYKDTTFAMMRELQKRGHTLAACETKDIRWQQGECVTGFVRDIRLTGVQAGDSSLTGVQAGDSSLTGMQAGDSSLTGMQAGDSSLTGVGKNWFTAEQSYPDERPQALKDFGAVVMRKDPPFDSEFFYSTHLLEQAEREGAKVFNKPRALRDHPEKLAIMEFPQFIGPTLVTRDASDIKRFHAEHKDIILKPLDGMGGMGIFRVKEDGLNLGSMIETLNKGGAQSVMVQKFLPEIVKGDKRILVIGGKPVPFSLARIPQGSEVRGNLAVGGKGVAQTLSTRDFEIAHAIGPVLAARGLLLAGIDVIGDCVTEINVTSPTCFQEIFQQAGFDVAAMFVDALEAALGAD